MITESTGLGSKSTQVGGSGSPRALDGLARIMLRELAQEGKI
jgi:ribosomal protein S14